MQTDHIQSSYNSMNRQLQYEFDLTVHRVQIETNFQCSVQVWWRKNKQKAITRNPINLFGHSKGFDINQSLSIHGVCHLRNSSFQPKVSSVQLIMSTKDGANKLIGSLSLDMTSIIDPQHTTVNCSRRFEKQLENCPSKSKIVFTLTARFVRECSDHSLADVSFQATGSNYNPRSTDMTFRPPSPSASTKKSSRTTEETHTYYPLKEIQPKLEQKLQPSRERPLEFSFSPVNNLQHEREKKDLLERISSLNNQLQQKTREVSKLKYNGGNQQRDFNAEKTLGMINELNSTALAMDQLKRERAEVMTQLAKIKEENRELLTALNQAREESYAAKDLANRFEAKKKALEEYVDKYEECVRERQSLKAEVFKKHSQLITLQRSLEEVQAGFKEAVKDQQKLVELKKSNQQFARQREELARQRQQLVKQREEAEKHITELQMMLNKERQQRDYLQKSSRRIQLDVEKERNTIKTKEQEREKLLVEIEREIQVMRADKIVVIKEKEEEVNAIREKLTAACRKIEEYARNESSGSNLTSQLKTKVKFMEDAYQSMEQQMANKDSIILQAKAYIQEKEEEITSLKQFIEQAKAYITTREQEFKTMMSERQCKENSSVGVSELEKYKAQCQASKAQLQAQAGEIARLRDDTEVQSKELDSCKNELNDRTERINDLEAYIGTIQDKLDESQDQIEELVRKTRSQQETLEDLVKKNLDMQIQINLQRFELQSVRTHR